MNIILIFLFVFTPPLVFRRSEQYVQALCTITVHYLVQLSVLTFPQNSPHLLHSRYVGHWSIYPKIGTTSFSKCWQISSSVFYVLFVVSTRLLQTLCEIDAAFFAGFHALQVKLSHQASQFLESFSSMHFLSILVALDLPCLQPTGSKVSA